MTKTQNSMEFISSVMGRFKNPAIMCSFGKDSMAMLYLIRNMGLRLPVVFFREPFYPEKYSFANRIIEELGLTVYDWPSRARSILHSKGGLEVISHYPFGAQTMMLPTGLFEPEDAQKERLCAKDDILLKPIGDFIVPWDVIFVGHRDDDVDPIQGKVKLKTDIVQSPRCPSVAFPIRNWTHRDVWDFTEENGVPVHSERYEKVDGNWREKEDKSKNPDWFPACSRCIDPRNEAFVFCPKLRATISNIGGSIPQTQVPSYYGNNA